MVSAVRQATRAKVAKRVAAEVNPDARSGNVNRRRKIENEEAQKAIYLAALSKCHTPGAALRVAKARYRDLDRWRELDAAFCVEEREAKESIADHLEQEAIRRAWKGSRKPVYQGGLLAGHVTEYSDQLLIFLLKGMRPEKYRDRSEVSVNPIVKTVAGFTTDDVL